MIPTISMVTPTSSRTMCPGTDQLREERRRRAGGADRLVDRVDRGETARERAGIYTSTTTGKTSGRRRVCS